MDNFNLKKYLTESKLLKEYDDAWVENYLSQNGTKHVSYKSGKGVKMTDEDWAQHKGKYTINNGRIGYVKDDGSLHSVKLASSVGENDAIIKYMNDNYESDGSVPVVSENIDEDNVIDALYEKMQNMAGEDLDEFLDFYAPDIDNRDANAITNWVYGLNEDDAETIMDDLSDINHAMGYIEDLSEKIEAEDDTEFTVDLQHLLDKHVSKGGETKPLKEEMSLEDDDEEYTSKGDPNIDKGDFYDYSPYGFTIRFLGYEDGDDVIVRGNGFFSEKVKNGKE